VLPIIQAGIGAVWEKVWRGILTLQGQFIEKRV